MREEEWFLSAEANRETVPLPASPSVAVVLCVRVGVRVSTVSQGGAVDQRRVVEALHIELGSVLRTVGETETGEMKKTDEENFEACRSTHKHFNTLLLCIETK